jgi:hypothetical protein
MMAMSGWLKTTRLGANMTVDLNLDLSTLSDWGLTQSFPLVPSRMESTTPASYRLVRERSGELTLQGAYHWHQGPAGGFEWRDIETVNRAEMDIYAEQT